jgi:DeoR/GlpR family transcriptional regulator of sugar metabolism
MYVTYKMLAHEYGCSESTIRRRVKEMELSGMYPTGVRRICGVTVDQEQFEEYCSKGRARGSEYESKTICSGSGNIVGYDRRNIGCGG